MLGLLIPPWAKWLALALLVATIWGHGWVKGNGHGTAKLTEYIGKQAIAAAAVVVKQGAVTERVVVQYRDRVGKTQIVERTIERDVIRYANPTACLDARWGVLHDAAATNTLPTPPGGTDGAGRTAPAADVALETVTGNYAACTRTSQRLDALQNWIYLQQQVK